MTAKTKDAQLKERDRVHKAYKAVTAQLLAENRERLPAAAAFADWLATNPGPDDRHAAVMMINNTLIAVDGMEDPIPEDLHAIPPGTFHQLRVATLTKKTTQTAPTAQPTKKDEAAMLTINISSAADAERLPALLAAVMAQFGAGIPSCSPAEVKKDVFAPVFADTAVAQVIEPVAEEKKRTRKAKVEVEAPAPVVEVQPEPVVEAVAEPEPVVEAPVVAEPEPVVEEVAAEPAKTYTDKDVLAALQAFARTPGGVPKIKEILAGFGATNLNTIKPEDYAAVIEAVAVPA